MFNKKVPKAKVEEAQTLETDNTNIGMSKPATDNISDAIDYYNKTYLGLIDRNEVASLTAIEVQAQQQEQLFAIYCELRKLNRK